MEAQVSRIPQKQGSVAPQHMAARSLVLLLLVAGIRAEDENDIRRRIEMLRDIASAKRAGASELREIELALGDADADARFEAAVALYAVGGRNEKADTEIRRALRSQDRAARARVAERLAGTGAIGIRMLAGELEQPETRSVALFGISTAHPKHLAEVKSLSSTFASILREKLPPQDAQSCLETAASSPQIAKACAAEAVRYLKVAEHSNTVIQVLRASGPEVSGRHLAALLDYVGGSKKVGTIEQAAALCASLGHRGVEGLLDRLGRIERRQQAFAILRGLEEASPDLAVGLLVEAANTPNPILRKWAIAGLESAEARVSEAFDATIAAFSDPDAEVRKAASFTAPSLAVRLRKPRAIDTLTALSESKELPVRLAAMTCIAQFAQTEQVERILVRGLGDASPQVRVAAVHGVVLHPRPMEAAIGPLTLIVDRREAFPDSIRALAKCGPQDKHVVAVLLRLLVTGTEYEQRLAAIALARGGAKSAVALKRLTAMNGEPKVGVRIPVRFALWRAGGRYFPLYCDLRGALSEYPRLSIQEVGAVLEVLRLMGPAARPLGCYIESAITHTEKLQDDGRLIGLRGLAEAIRQD